MAAPAVASGADVRVRRLVEVMAGAVPTDHGPGLRVGVDLGTACMAVVACDGTGEPLAGAYEWTGVVRDGVVVDFHGAIAALRRLTAVVEDRLGLPLRHAAAGFPPGVNPAEVRAVEHVLDAAGLTCTALVGEPQAANAVLGVTDGAVVDVGGGTTGIAVFADGRLVHVVDEPTGGIHATLVLAGALGLSVEEAEAVKRDPGRADEVAPVIRPVFEKIGTIVSRAVARHPVAELVLVGGTCRFPTAARVIGEAAGLPWRSPVDPMFVTVLGLADADDPRDPGGLMS